MEYVYIGKIVNTHGIKGELRIISDFDKKEIVFKPGFAFYLGDFKKKEIVNSYRRHKNFDRIISIAISKDMYTRSLVFIFFRFQLFIFSFKLSPPCALYLFYPPFSV